jgi:DNA replication licensing factor MCM5
LKRKEGFLRRFGILFSLPDGLFRRGDVNVLLVGDPGTAKSQLLKFAEKVSPIGVYTSGKGSSAAGLTASVIRDPSSKNFVIEGNKLNNSNMTFNYLI